MSLLPTKSQHAWRHNQFTGHVHMSRQNMLQIADASSVTEEGKLQARVILSCLEKLDRELKQRVDPPEYADVERPSRKTARSKSKA